MGAPSGNHLIAPLAGLKNRGVIVGADGIKALARILRGSVSRQAKILVTRNPPNPKARARRSQRSTVGSFCTSVAVEGLSMTKLNRRPERIPNAGQTHSDTARSRNRPRRWAHRP